MKILNIAFYFYFLVVLNKFNDFLKKVSDKPPLYVVVIPFKEPLPLKIGEWYLVLENVKVVLVDTWSFKLPSFQNPRINRFAIGFYTDKPLFQLSSSAGTSSSNMAYIWIGNEPQLEIVPKNFSLNLCINASELRSSIEGRGIYGDQKAIGLLIFNISRTENLIKSIDFSDAYFIYKKKFDFSQLNIHLKVYVLKNCILCSNYLNSLKYSMFKVRYSVYEVSESNKYFSQIKELSDTINMSIKYPLTLLYIEEKLKSILIGFHSDLYVTFKLPLSLPKEGLAVITKNRDIIVIKDPLIIKKIDKIFSD